MQVGCSGIVAQLAPDAADGGSGSVDNRRQICSRRRSQVSTRRALAVISAKR